jgi:hypothetical protein
MTRKISGIFGYLLDRESDIYKKIIDITNEIEILYNFKPQKNLHSTLIYLGKDYNDYSENLLYDEEFIKTISEFKNQKCTLKCLKFNGVGDNRSLIITYEFSDKSFAEKYHIMTRKYEKYLHTIPHLTLGTFKSSYGNRGTVAFNQNKKDYEMLLINESFDLDVQLIKITDRLDYEVLRQIEHKDQDLNQNQSSIHKIEIRT